MESIVSQPKVSVIIPFYNRESFLREAIESLIQQSFSNWEAILIDDASTDQSREIALEYAEAEPEKFVIIDLPENVGPSAARKAGIDVARGEFISFLDSDDYLYTDSILKLVESFDSQPEVDAVFGTLIYWNSWADQSKEDFRIDLGLQPSKIYSPPELFVNTVGAGGSKPGINSIMVRTQFARKWEVFEERYSFAGEDQIFWAKVTLNGSVMFIDETLSKYRQHTDSTTFVEANTKDEIRSLNELSNYLTEYAEGYKTEFPEVPKAARIFKRRLFIEQRLQGLKSLYRRLFSLEQRYRLRRAFTLVSKKLLRSSHRKK